MRRNNSEFKTNFVSEAGTFTTNKDYFAFMELDDAACWVVADGIDSDEEIKSAELVVKSIFADFSEKPTISRRKIKKYIKNAHKLLEQRSKSVRLKASLIIVVTDYSKIVWASAGNARIYHFRKGRLNFQSKDQSIAQMLADAGKIDEYDIDEHEEKNNLVNYLGKISNFKPFVSRKCKLNDGDVMLLCTSGFWEKVNSVEIINALNDTEAPEEFVDILEEILLSKQKKVLNNYTAAAVFANKVFIENKKEKIALIKKIALIMLPILLIVALIIAYKIVDSRKQAQIRAELIKDENNGDNFVKDGSFDKALKAYEDAENCQNKLKAKDKKGELDKRLNITQLITDGDKSFTNKKFDKAEINYKKAKKLADTVDAYDKKELINKIAATEDYLSLLALEKQGDTKAGNQDFPGAKALYTKAKAIADKDSFSDAEKDLQSKMDAADSKMAAIDKQQKTLQGSDLEKAGDDSYAVQDYAKALQSYEAAQTMYQQLNNLQGVLSIETKIQDVQGKLNPPQVPAPAPAPAGDASKTTTGGSSGGRNN
jgi:serine/threonine protein phosphatase PrpC